MASFASSANATREIAESEDGRDGDEASSLRLCLSAAAAAPARESRRASPRGDSREAEHPRRRRFVPPRFVVLVRRARARSRRRVFFRLDGDARLREGGVEPRPPSSPARSPRSRSVVVSAARSRASPPRPTRARHRRVRPARARRSAAPPPPPPRGVSSSSSADASAIFQRAKSLVPSTPSRNRTPRRRRERGLSRNRPR